VKVINFYKLNIAISNQRSAIRKRNKKGKTANLRRAGSRGADSWRLIANYPL